MTKALKAAFFAASVSSLILIVFPAAAQINFVQGNCGFPGIVCGGGQTFGTLGTWILNAITVVLSLVGVVAIAFLVYAGYRYITSGGSEEHARTAKRQILYATLGIIVALGASLIVQAIINQDPLIIFNLIAPYINMAIFLITIVSIAFLVYAGYRYITSGGNQEAAGVAKRQILYAVLGIIVAIFSGVIVQAVRNQDATQIENVISQYIFVAQYLVSIIATVFVIYGGVQLITSRGDQEQAATGRRTIALALLGIFVITIAGVIVRAVIDQDGTALRVEIFQLVNGLLVLTGIVASAFVVIGGALYITSAGDEERAATGRRTVIYALLGLAVILIAAALVNLIIFAVQ